MGGRPVWLASITLRDSVDGAPGKLIPVERWADPEFRQAQTILQKLLRGVGDQRWGRLFRMNMSLCLHRGLSDAEIAGLPDWWRQARPTYLAGGPIEIYWSCGVVQGCVSCDPCSSPGRHPLPGYDDPAAWLPIDCGRCPPCRARAAIEHAIDAGADTLGAVAAGLFAGR